MKAVVMHIAGNHAVLLRQDGGFAREKNRGYRVGQRIGVRSARRPVLKPLLALASAVLVLFSATALAANFLPFSYVSVDVNPSLVMTLNWFDRVLSVEAANKDGEEIAEQLLGGGVVGQPVGDAVQRVYAALEAEDYFQADTANDVVVAVASYGIKDTEPILEQIKQMQTVQNSGTELNVQTVLADRAMVAEAEALQTTAGKLAMVKPIAGDSMEKTQEWLGRPVREIIAAGQGGAEDNEITLIIETQPPESTEPQQTLTPVTEEPAGQFGGDPSQPQQASPTASVQGEEQNGPSQTSEPTVASAAPPQSTGAPAPSPKPPDAPQNTASGPGTTGGSVQTQPAAPPDGGQGKGN